MRNIFLEQIDPKWSYFREGRRSSKLSRTVEVVEIRQLRNILRRLVHLLCPRGARGSSSCLSLTLRNFHALFCRLARNKLIGDVIKGARQAETRKFKASKRRPRGGDRDENFSPRRREKFVHSRGNRLLNEHSCNSFPLPLVFSWSSVCFLLSPMKRKKRKKKLIIAVTIQFQFLCCCETF